MDKLVNATMRRMKKSGYFDDDDNYDVIRFGLELFFMKVIIYSLTMIAGIIFGGVISVICFMLVYQPIRGCCGGYHANSRIVCIIVSVLMLVSTISLSKIEINRFQALSLVIVSILCIMIQFIIAPVDTKYKPFDDVEKNVFRKRSILVLILASVVIIIIYILNWNEPLWAITLAIVFSTFFLVIGKIKRKKEVASGNENSDM
ncbi:MAG TPA: hypothetical protein DDX72_10420 [Ruminococcaceae bacterium]|nr:hypothetical protein [Oscillospiraceae bacterium]